MAISPPRGGRRQTGLAVAVEASLNGLRLGASNRCRRHTTGLPARPCVCGPFAAGCRPSAGQPGQHVLDSVGAQLPPGRTGPELVWPCASCRDRLSCWSWSLIRRPGAGAFVNPLRGRSKPLH